MAVRDTWCIAYDFKTGTPGGVNVVNERYGSVLLPLTDAGRSKLYRVVTNPLAVHQFIETEYSFRTRTPSSEALDLAVLDAFTNNEYPEVIPRRLNLHVFPISLSTSDWTDYGSRRAQNHP